MDTLIELVKMYAVELRRNERICARINELQRFLDEEEREHFNMMDRITPEGVQIATCSTVNIDDVRKHLSIRRSAENEALLAEINRRRRTNESV